MPPVDANVVDRSPTGGAWPPLAPLRPRASDSVPPCPPGLAAPLSSAPLTPSPLTSVSRQVPTGNDVVEKLSTNTDLEFPPISDRDMVNSELNHPMSTFDADSSRPICKQNVGGISPLADGTDVATPPAPSRSADASGPTRPPLDFNKVIRGFTSASNRHTKASIVPPSADAIEAILLELAKPKKDRIDVLDQISLARPYSPKVAMAHFTVRVMH
ncbi:hypothetical protein H310_08438 [Aphanomyces invadans]|uniref:Uncharacterized protein n=1 Tax=Aphanomyces invadans TaxID=157072 RepID=A0A024TYB3_9STRA|nr:hypothetical protein H310_08438 [Aphanomyces invadans]ETV98959.1 hypothetical protein H310_08438 [Aphanomyces invadans]|eukprot:XP_008872387.1 hypothetical protein H310_08438 [Aphanomyces invadans]